MKQKLIRYFFLALLAGFVSACKEDAPPLPDNIVNLESDSKGILPTENDVEIKVLLNRIESTPVEVVLSLKTDGVSYDEEFTTAPEAENGEIKLTIPAGSLSSSVKLTKKQGAVFNGKETIDFTLKQVTNPIFVGNKSNLKLNFSGIISEAGTLTLNGRTAASPYFNAVYVDLSSNTATEVPRNSWNLGFYNGGEFRVILNAGYQSVVAATSKSDINTVSYADTTGIRLNFPMGEGSLDMVDGLDGSLSKTAIAEISATSSDNKVYLLGFENNRAGDKLYKIKISRNGQGYKLQYAKIGETEINTLDITKDSRYNFTFVSVENKKIVEAEPKAANWDFQWGYSTYDSGLKTPYWFQDFVSLNTTGGATAAEVLNTATLTYDTFTAANTTDLKFEAGRDVIGAKWRSGGGPTSQPAVRTDRFYVIKDKAGNIYKLRFTSLGANGERGKPVIEYKLLSKAS